ncbi:DUF4921 family protein [Flaviflexus massiliensis]|uniref:DUF4921 family protein n=1 Tax=Flaviflexus massiliensis TaxID=1522309 RepID=UPI0006D54F02|nr:DUF4921 family protein [Flaviflexus massiliensis]
MAQTQFSQAAPLTKMADGTVKQVNPFSGTEVWTVPGRANRPLTVANPDPTPINPEKHGQHCVFCTQRVLESPPEKTRIVRKENGHKIIASTSVDDLTRPWEFRRVPNLFEILSFDYWRKNYGHELPREAAERRDRYITDPAGKAHVLKVLQTKAAASGIDYDDWIQIPESQRLAEADAFFGGGHDVIISRRHFIDGAEMTNQLAGSGTLTPTEHEWYMRLTIEAMRDLYASNRYVRYVQAFQNWLKPAGASFDHLHKQLVAIDQRSGNTNHEISRVRANPNVYNEMAVDYAGYQNLIVAENRYAVAFAGFGHRYPTLEVFSKSAEPAPWLQSSEEQRGMSDLLHAMHVATGPLIATNEEWHHRPIDVDMPMPWRIMLKWRVSTLAGFEGGSKIYVNTIDPWSLRDRVVPKLLEARANGEIASSINIATECTFKVNSLRYNPYL